MSICPCGSSHDYLECCGLYIDKGYLPLSPETLMRSRYTAYTMANIAYIKNTMCGKMLLNFNEFEARQWSTTIIWMGLQVLQHRYDGVDKGFVEFIASYLDKEQLRKIHEISEFIKIDDKWFYSDGVQSADNNVALRKFPRNSPCPCNSQKKFKNCHGKSRF